MLSLLKRKASSDFALASRIAGGEFTIWVEYEGEEHTVLCIGGESGVSGRPLPMGQLIRQEGREVSVMVGIDKLPEGYVLKEAARIHAAESGVRAEAKSYTIDTVNTRNQNAGFVRMVLKRN